MYVGKDEESDPLQTNVLLDCGSNVTLITERLAKRLCLVGRKSVLNLNGIGDTRTALQSAKCDILVRSKDNRYTGVWKNVQVVPEIAGALKAHNWTKELSAYGISDDITPFAKGEIDLLVGNDQREIQRQLDSVCSDIEKDPLAIRNVLGWTVSGNIDAPNSNTRENILYAAGKYNDEYDPATDGSLVTFCMHSNVLQRGPAIPKCAPQGDLKVAARRTIQERIDSANLQRITDMMEKATVYDQLPKDTDLSVDEQHAIDTLQRTFRLENGRATVSPLWKIGQPADKLNTFRYAFGRLKSVRQKLSREHFAVIDTIFTDYLKKGIARDVTDQVGDPWSEDAIYWAHFPVEQPRSETTPVRPVMDGKAICICGKSINDYCFLQGPNLMCDLTKVLLRFRQYDYAFTGDVSKMFLKILVPEEFRKYNRFLWYKGYDDDTLRILEFLGHLFGNVGSPTCAIWTVQKLATEFKEKYPRASEAILRSTIVDDTLDSCPTVKEAADCVLGLIAILSEAGLEIAKFATNSPELAKQIPGARMSDMMHEFEKYYQTNQEEYLENPDGVRERIDPIMRTLGQYWNIQKDKFGFKLYTPDIHEQWDKLKCLSQAHKIFDPLGYAAPYLLESRLFLQDLWKKGYDWKKPLDPEEDQRWREWLKDLPNVQKLEFDRVIKPGDPSTYKSCQLHVFSDASKEAFAASAYIRIEFKDSKKPVHTNFIQCKYHINPSKPARTIPKMELMGLHLGAELANHVGETLSIDKKDTFLWTDSKTALQWLNMEPRSLRTLAHNYTTKIKKLFPVECVRWVPGEHNPADMATRPKSVRETLDCSMWERGPSFLKDHPDTWPKLPEGSLKERKPDPDVLDQVKREFKLFNGLAVVKEFDTHRTALLSGASRQAVNLSHPSPKGLADGPKDTEVGEDGTIAKDYFLPKYYKDWRHQRLVFSWVWRFASICARRAKERKQGKTPPPLGLMKPSKALFERLAFPRREDYAEAATRLIHRDQHVHFERTIFDIIKRGSVKVGHALSKLGPVYLPHMGKTLGKEPMRLVRISGRLGSAGHLTPEVRAPLLLHPASPLTQSIIDYHHSDELQHTGGIKCLMCSLQRIYWISGTITQIKRRIRQCVTCRMARPKMSQQLMGPLPEFRVPSDKTGRLAAFSTTALDCAGPWYTPQGPGRVRAKRYLLIFRCAMYGAVHLEMLENMDTSSFLMSLDAFISRRGKPDRIVCDNGRNFVGGKAVLEELLRSINQAKVVRTHPTIDWYFTPPEGPHMNGLIERLVGVAKDSLKTALPPNAKDALLRATFHRVERYMNNRPIWYKHDSDPNDPECLTPAHFLTAGRPIEDLAPVDARTKSSLGAMYNQLQRVLESFWERFVQEAIPTLHRYAKWSQERQPFERGQVVVVLDDTLKTGANFPRGYIRDVKFGEDGIPRRVTVQTNTGLYERPIGKVYRIMSDKFDFSENDYIAPRPIRKWANRKNKVPAPKPTIYSTGKGQELSQEVQLLRPPAPPKAPAPAPAPSSAKQPTQGQGKKQTRNAHLQPDPNANPDALETRAQRRRREMAQRESYCGMALV